LDRPTLTALGVRLPVTGDDNWNARVTVRYRQSGATAWRKALPLFRVHPESVARRSVAPQFAGSIFDLRPGTSYDIQLHLTDPDGAVDRLFTLQASTRAVPRDPANPRVRNVTDAGSLQAALNTAQPGDVITLAKGYYPGLFIIGAAGTPANPIVIRAASQDGAVLDGGNCSVCNVIEVYGSYVHIERVLIQRAQRAIRFQTAGATGNVVRRVHIRDVTLGIGGRQDQTDFYIADNILEGRLSWPLIYTVDGGRHANDDGISVMGFGHVVAHNNISGFGDAMKTAQDGARAVDFYGNEVLFTYDNGVELDGSEGNTRALRNRFTNCYEPLSVQPTYSGPVYMMRNIGVNNAGEPMKFHGLAYTPPPEPNGVFAYHNTFVSPVYALNMMGAPSHHFAIRNNLFIGPKTQTYNTTVNWLGAVDDGIFDYNGYYPDGKFIFATPTGYATYSNFASMTAAGQFEPHGVLLQSSPFISGLVGPVAYTRLMPPFAVQLAPDSGALDRGVVLPNVNDNFTGAAPDLGAVERRCRASIYGPRPEGVDETNQPFGCAQ
jgi:hypothetical protein